MYKELTDEFLERTAREIDADCLACHKALTPKAGKASRSRIHKTLTTIGDQWDANGAQGTIFTDALKKGCAACLTYGRSRARLYSLTCGIATRLPEHLSIDRPNRGVR